MHDTLTPLGGMVPLLHMMLNVVFGGAGVGLMNMLIYAIIAVFICGLMIGRTPEYLGKKIEGKEMKLAALCIIIHPLLILGFSAIAVACQAGLEGITNPDIMVFLRYCMNLHHLRQTMVQVLKVWQIILTSGILQQVWQCFWKIFIYYHSVGNCRKFI